uniref:Retrotransposon protein n=1 Tax=Oryza rufipogon TaxID=4529 RepID=A0A2I4S7P2_ORYRU|nr:retrotransposon protein [Oryza rufipogon]
MADRRGPQGKTARGPEGYDMSPRGLGAKRREGPRGMTWHPEALGQSSAKARGGMTWHPEAPDRSYDPRGTGVEPCCRSCARMERFFHEVLDFYEIHALHLAPNAVMTLTIFTHLCEMFVGVRPTMRLFQFFFVPQLLQGAVVGGCYFQPRPGTAGQYIESHLRKKWEDWKKDWFYTALPDHPRLRLPAGPPERSAAWLAASELGEEYDAVRDCLRGLRSQGLTGAIVFGDFFRRRIAPLQERSREAWKYTGPNDPMRTHVGERWDWGEDDAKTVIRRVVGLDSAEQTLIPDGILPLCSYRDQERIMAVMSAVGAGGDRSRRSGAGDSDGGVPPGGSSEELTRAERLPGEGAEGGRGPGAEAGGSPEPEAEAEAGGGSEPEAEAEAGGGPGERNSRSPLRLGRLRGWPHGSSPQSRGGSSGTPSSWGRTATFSSPTLASMEPLLQVLAAADSTVREGLNTQAATAQERRASEADASLRARTAALEAERKVLDERARSAQEFEASESRFSTRNNASRTRAAGSRRSEPGSWRGWLGRWRSECVCWTSGSPPWPPTRGRRWRRRPPFVAELDRTTLAAKASAARRSEELRLQEEACRARDSALSEREAEVSRREVVARRLGEQLTKREEAVAGREAWHLESVRAELAALAARASELEAREKVVQRHLGFGASTNYPLNQDEPEERAEKRVHSGVHRIYYLEREKDTKYCIVVAPGQVRASRKVGRGLARAPGKQIRNATLWIEAAEGRAPPPFFQVVKIVAAEDILGGLIVQSDTRRTQGKLRWQDRLGAIHQEKGGFSCGATGYDSIWVIVDRLTKTARFIPVKTNYSSAKLAELYMTRIVCLHGIPKRIISDRGTQFTSHFWEKVHEALGSYLAFSTAYHPQTDGQTERTNQVLEDMLRACALDFSKNWERCLPYAEFSYNNSFQASLKMSPNEALFGRRCRTPLMWSETGERVVFGPDIIQEAEEKVRLIRDRLKVAQSRQKSYADTRRRNLEFKEGDYVYLKVSPMRGTKRFKVKGKLAPRYVGPFQIIARRGKVAYQLQLPENIADVHPVFHVSQLKKCLRVPEEQAPLEEIHISNDLTYPEHPIRILDEAEKRTRSKVWRMYKVQWSNHTEDEATWESEEFLRTEYPHLFEDW